MEKLELTKSKYQLKIYDSEVQQSPILRVPSIHKPEQPNDLNFSKSTQPSSEVIEAECRVGNLRDSFIQTNRYFMDLKENELESEKVRLKGVMYGPCILVARTRKDYYKMMSFRKHRIFKLKTIREIEKKYNPEDRYFESIKDYKSRLENLNEKNIRDFLKMFYLEE